MILPVAAATALSNWYTHKDPPLVFLKGHTPFLSTSYSMVTFIVAKEEVKLRAG